MSAGHEEHEWGHLHPARDFHDHHVAVEYQTPGDIDIPVIANWVGDLCK